MTLSALGIFSAAGAGGVPAVGAYELIETSVVSGSSTTSITFSNLATYASTYKHLQIRYAARQVYASYGMVSIFLRMNGDTGSNYAWHLLGGGASTVYSSSGITQSRIHLGYLAASTAPTNAFGAGVVDILDSYSTTKNKTMRSISGFAQGSGDTGNVLSSGVWLNTASLTSLTIVTDASTAFIAGSRFSIYGIR